MSGLRERKKERTRRAISEAAIALFLEHGFDQVSVADVAAAAEVSKPTLFSYFPSKEDLVVHRFADHQDQAADVVRGRKPGESVLAALHRDFLDGLGRRDPVTGLNDHPAVLAFGTLVYSTPSLVARAAQYTARAEASLAEALREAPDLPPPRALTAPLLAAQITATLRVLAEYNRHRIAEDGRTADDLHFEATNHADRAFELLELGYRAEAAGHSARDAFRS
ncbi:TetR family transcriptional regulator [Kitasatospora aureofaciens]|uniref:TetR family transcriptional regulator n=1 Tax=Kitasatospora aureofaciens TaxID=1894 RepID=UPI001C476DF5|nr:TetR family transcriptional regulator [Kitasatospora aureofaciens]MBV6700636.1 TetR/AcrR family transcriptional regulator [Kitasatospora aureofaciens]